VRADQVPSGNDGSAAATAAAASASGAGTQATSQSLGWVYGEHSSGASGWFPRCAGNFFSIDSANSTTAMKLEPLDSKGGIFAAGNAITRNELPAPQCRALLVAALKNLWRCEGLYVQALGVLVGGFIQPLEMRDSKAKQTLLADPYLTICANQLRDMFFYHSQFFKACGVAANGLDSEHLEAKSDSQGSSSSAHDEQEQLLALANGLSALISRFTLYREYVSNLPAAFNALFSSSGKLGKPLAKFLEQHPLPLLDESHDDSGEGNSSSKGGAAAAAAAAAKSNLAARLEAPAKHYREYQPMLELLLRCVTASAPGVGRTGGNSSAPAAPAAAAAALGASFVDLTKATSTVDLARASSLTNARLLELQSQFVGRVQVLAKGRQLLQGGKLFKIHASDKTSATKEQRVVHLFNDVLIYSIPMSSGRLQFRK